MAAQQHVRSYPHSQPQPSYIYTHTCTWHISLWQAPLLVPALLGGTPLALLPLALDTSSLLLLCITAGATILPTIRLNSLCRSTAPAPTGPCLLLLLLLLCCCASVHTVVIPVHHQLPLPSALPAHATGVSAAERMVQGVS
jgi:hypothetical protein